MSARILLLSCLVAAAASLLALPVLGLPPDLPDPQFKDEDNDGIDGCVATSIFVDAATGVDAVGRGTMSQPLRTIGYALGEASVYGKTALLVAKGTYNERVLLDKPVSIYGGYDGPPLWGRSASNETLIISTTPTDSAYVLALSASYLTNKRTVVADVTIAAGDAPANASSIAARALLSPQLAFERVVFRAGAGGAGSGGHDGGDGFPGYDGCSGGLGSCDTNGPGGWGGSGGWSGPGCGGSEGGTGGAGGPDGRNPGYAGSASPGGAAGGAGGYGGNPGGPGWPGANGANGTSGAAGSAGTAGTWNGLMWLPTQGGSGQSGMIGIGGGGGGGGGGQGCGVCDDGPGNGGGGGGAGGCGGGGATGGRGGGASIALLLGGGSPNATASDCTFETGTGGAGGRGGNGGCGGAGGAGGLGGTACTSEVGAGGSGGKGGTGGAGGAGCSGNGGPAYGVYCADGSVNLSGNFYIIGSAGAPGAPGTNPLGQSASGNPGARAAVAFSYPSPLPTDSVKATPQRVRCMYPVQVKVNILDAQDYTVTANDITLSKDGPGMYSGSIAAPQAPGTFPVVVRYGEHQLTTSVQVQRVLAVRGRDASSVMGDICANHLFHVYGRVIARTGNSVIITDGSASPVKVVGDSKLFPASYDGRFISFYGILDSTKSPATLYADAAVDELNSEGPPPPPFAVLPFRW